MSAAWQDFALLNRELADAVEAGVPLPEALRRIARDVARPATRALLAEAAADVEAGTPLPAAIEGRAGGLPPAYAALVRAGMEGGNLAEILRRSAREAEHAGRFRRQVLLSSLYPGVVVLLCLVFFTVMALVLRQAGPAATAGQGLLPGEAHRTAASLLGWPVRHLWLLWAAFGLPLLLYGAGVLLGPRSETLHRLRWRVLLGLPFLSRTVEAGLRARLFHSLETVLRAGLPLPRALHLVRETLADTPMGDEAAAMELRAEGGATLSAALEASPLLPPSAVWAVEAAEARDDVPAAVESLARAEQDRYERGRELLRSFAGPLFSVAAGLVLLWAILTIYVGYLGLLRVAVFH